MFIGVEAKDYYSNYSTWSNWTNEKIVESELIKVETNEKYKYYHEDMIGDYYMLGTNPSIYPNVDKTIYKNVYSGWTSNKGDDKEGRTYESRTKYYYKDALKVKYIVISGINGSYGSLRISELVIKDNIGNNIGYTYECDKCNDNFNNYINNGNINENLSDISNGGSLRIILNSEYSYDNIDLVLFLYDVTKEYKTFDIKFYNNLFDKSILEAYQYNNFICNDLSDIKEFDYNYKNMDVVNIKYGETMESDEEVEPSVSRIVNIVMEYRYYDKYYYYFVKNKIYSDYLDKPTDYYNKKDDSYITYYRYCTRDKLSIEDNIIITSSDDKLENHVKSTQPITIETNIDINNNGKYKAKFITSFIEVEQDIEVNISNKNIDEKIENNSQNIDEYKKLINKMVELQNKLNETNNIEEYNKLIEEVNNYKIKINSLNMEIEKYKIELKNKEQEKNTMGKVYENEIFNLKLNNQNKEETKTNNWPILKINSNYLWIIPFIGLVLIIYATYRKYKNKN